MLGGLAVALWVGLTVPAVLGIITRADLTVLHAVATVRSASLTRLMLDVDAVRSPWTVRVLSLGTIAVLIALRRFRHLAAYLVVFLAADAAGLDHDAGDRPDAPSRDRDPRALGGLRAAVAARRDAGPGPGRACSTHSCPPGGGGTGQSGRPASSSAIVCAARLYLAVDHPTDQVTALIVGWSLAVVAFRLVVPNDVFPVSYRGGRKAHLDIGGRRGEAIVSALDHQLGLDGDPRGAVRPGSLRRLDPAAH